MGDCVLLTGRHRQREVFMGSTSAAVFVSHAPKGSDCFERKIFKKGHKKLTFYKSSEIGNLATFQTVSTLSVS